MRRPATWPWWAQVLAVHALARAFSAVVLVVVARSQEATPWTDAAPSYLPYTGLMWDGSWYREIAEDGYPAELPRGTDGRVLQNAWAFFPLFPALCRVLMAVTGGPWHVVAPLLALVLGAAAMLVVDRAVGAGAAGAGQPVGRAVPLATVAVLTTSATAPVLQVAYTESLALLLLAGALWLVLTRRYVAAMPVVLALGLTRAVALPLTLVVVAHGLLRLRDARGAGTRWPVGERVRLGALTVVTVVSGLLWPVLVGLLTGQPDAYAQTQSAWRARGEVVPVLPWIDLARWLAGGWWAVVLGLLVAIGVLVVAGRPMARLGTELRVWTAAYLGYLIVVVEPGTSVLRFGLLAFPVAGVLAQLAVRSRWPRAATGVLVVVGLVGQVAWVWLVWRLVPPSGWPP